MKTDVIRKGITSKLDSSIGTLFQYFISNIAKNDAKNEENLLLGFFIGLRSAVTLTKLAL